MPSGITFCNPAFFELTGMEYFYIDRPALLKSQHPLMVHLGIMPEVMHGKIFVNGFKE